MRCPRPVADEDCLWADTVSDCHYATFSAKVLRRRWCGGGRGGKGVAYEFTEQVRVGTCAKYRDIFLRERGVGKGARVFRCQVGIGRGKEGCPKTRTECKGACKIEGCDH